MEGRILLVSPTVGARARREQWLRAAGFSVDIVATFEEARRRLTSRGPDVLLTDVRLNGFNGLHLAIVGLQNRPSLVVIAIGAPDAALAREAERHGVVFLVEPVTDETLVAAVETGLRERPKRGRSRRRMADPIAQLSRARS